MVREARPSRHWSVDLTVAPVAVSDSVSYVPGTLGFAVSSESLSEPTAFITGPDVEVLTPATPRALETGAHPRFHVPVTGPEVSSVSAEAGRCRDEVACQGRDAEERGVSVRPQRPVGSRWRPGRSVSGGGPWALCLRDAEKWPIPATGQPWEPDQPAWPSR